MKTLKKIFTVFFIFLCLTLLTTYVYAYSFIYEDDTIIEIQNIYLDNIIYNVNFIDCTWNNLYENENIIFENGIASIPAANSLIEIFNDMPLINYWDIKGIEKNLNDYGVLLIPNANEYNGKVAGSAVWIKSDSGGTIASAGTYSFVPTTEDSSDYYTVWAVWSEATPVATPEPSTLLLLASALLWLAFIFRKRSIPSYRLK